MTIYLVCVNTRKTKRKKRFQVQKKETRSSTVTSYNRYGRDDIQLGLGEANAIVKQ